MEYLIEVKEDENIVYRKHREEADKLILLTKDKSRAIVGKTSMAFVMALFIFSVTSYIAYRSQR